MPWRRITAAQWIILIPVIIKALAWLLLMVASLLKILGHSELAAVLLTISSALGLVDAKRELDNVKKSDGGF